jgi:hypothetical protein
VRDRRGPVHVPRREHHATRLEVKHAKLARSVTTLGDAVNDTKRVLSHCSGSVTVLGVVGGPRLRPAHSLACPARGPRRADSRLRDRRDGVRHRSAWRIPPRPASIGTIAGIAAC